MLDITPIQQDIQKDRRMKKVCESCNQRLSEYLYILKSIMFGIFHVCEQCKEELDCSETEQEVKTMFIKKARNSYSNEPEPIR